MSTQAEPQITRKKTATTKRQIDEIKKNNLLLSEIPYDDNLRMLNFQMLMFACVSVLMVLIYQDICFNRDNLEFSEDYAVCPEAFILKLVAWGCYVLLVWRLVIYYRVQTTRKMKLWGFETQEDAFWKSGLWKNFVLELLINALMPLPVPMDWAFQNNVVIFFTSTRVYLFVRLLRDYSNVYRNRDAIRTEATFREFAAFDHSIGYGTVLKTYFFTYTILFVSGMFLFSVFFLSYMMFLSEREYWVDTTVKPFGLWKASQHNGMLPPESYTRNWLWEFDSCLWFVTVTMTTLGYGDIYPVAWQGRLFAIIAVLLGCVLTALIVGVITNKLAPTEFEELVMGWMKKERMRAMERNLAASVIQSAWREYTNMKNIGDPIKKAQLTGKRIKSSIRPFVKRFRTLKRNLYEAEKLDDKRTSDTNKILLSQMDGLQTQLEELVSLIHKSAPR